MRTQGVTVHVRTSSSRPPVATRDAYVDVATRTIVPARTEKVEKIAKSGGYDKILHRGFVKAGKITSLKLF